MPEIQKKLKLLGKPASLRTIERVAQRNRLQQQGITPAKKTLPAHQLSVACCESNIKIVDDWIKDPNPPTQREIARRLGVSVSSVRRIFKKLGGVKRLKKRTTHFLTAKMAAQRLERGKLFLKKLSRYKLKFIFTMDEMQISTDDINGQTNFYYKRKEWWCLKIGEKCPAKTGRKK